MTNNVYANQADELEAGRRRAAKIYECSWPSCGCEQGCAADDANDRAEGICEECEHPKDSEAHREHCPEAIRG